MYYRMRSVTACPMRWAVSLDEGDTNNAVFSVQVMIKRNISVIWFRGKQI